MTWTATTSPSSGDVYTKSRWDLQVKGNLDHIQDNCPIIQLPLISAISPLSGITPAALAQAESSAGSPKPNWLHASADAAADEGYQWFVALPRDYGSTPVIRVWYYMASATTNEVVLACQISACSDGDAFTSQSFDSANSVTDTVPGTAGLITYADITLTNADSMAANDLINIYIYRDADNGDDDATGDCEIVHAALLYSIA